MCPWNAVQTTVRCAARTPGRIHPMVKENRRDPDAWQRINYLAQIGQAMLVQGQASKSASNLARLYQMDLKRISKRLVLRLSPEAKRCACKGCHAVLIPGKSSTYRVTRADNNELFLTIRCRACGFVKKFPVSCKSADPAVNTITRDTET